MKAHGLDPRCLDVAAAAQQGELLEGATPLAALRRLAESAHSDAPPAADELVSWQAQAQSRLVRAAPPEIWLHLTADTRLSLVCQRCLQPVPTEVHAERSFRFVEGEAEAERLDAESDDDVLVLTRTLDVLELVEDELLLSLPLVPRHAVCPQPLRTASEPLAPAERPNPFAALSALKRGGLPS